MKLAPIALFLLMSAAFAATPVEMLDQLRAELRTERRSALDKGNGENNQRLFQIESLLVEQLPAGELLEEQFSLAIKVLGQLRSLTRVAKTEELCQSLILELRTLEIARSKRFKETLDATVKDALLTGLKAKTAKDVDAPLLALANLQKQCSRGDYRVENQSLSTVTSFLTLLQDSMLPRVGPQRSRNSVGELVSMAHSYATQLGDMMPRSEFMMLLTEVCSRLDPDLSKKGYTLAEISRRSIELLRSVKRLEDIADAHQAMQALCPESATTPANLSAAAEMLGKMYKFHEDLKAGASVSFSSLDFPAPAPVSEAGAVLRDLLIRKALPRVLQVTENSLQKDEENVSAYLGRMIQESQKNSDWPLLSRTLDAAQSLHITGLLTANDNVALRMLLAAVNHERAQIYSGAAAYYFGALRTGSQAVPLELIGQKLEAIRKEHPQDYDAGQNISAPDPTKERTGGYNYTISTSQRVNVGPAPTPAPLVVPAVPKASTTPKSTPAPAQEKKPPEPAKPAPAAGDNAQGTNLK